MEAETSCPPRNALCNIFLLFFPFYAEMARRPNESMVANLSSLFPVSLLQPEGSIPNHKVLLAFPFFTNLPNHILTVTYKDSRLCVCLCACLCARSLWFVWVFFLPLQQHFPILPAFIIPLFLITDILIKGQAK